MNDTVLLRHCPLCGGAATMVYSEHKVHDKRIMCTRCGLRTDWCTCEPEVLARMWNTRVEGEEHERTVGTVAG